MRYKYLSMPHNQHVLVLHVNMGEQIITETIITKILLLKVKE